MLAFRFIHRAGLCFLCKPRQTVRKPPPCASMECNVCTYLQQRAACSWPPSTTSATGSNSRLLTHRLTIRSRSELLHRRNIAVWLFWLTKREFECRLASCQSRSCLSLRYRAPSRLNSASQPAGPTCLSASLPSADWIHHPSPSYFSRVHLPGSTLVRSSNGKVLVSMSGRLRTRLIVTPHVDTTVFDREGNRKRTHKFAPVSGTNPAIPASTLTDKLITNGFDTTVREQGKTRHSLQGHHVFGTRTATTGYPAVYRERD